MHVIFLPRKILNWKKKNLLETRSVEREEKKWFIHYFIIFIVWNVNVTRPMLDGAINLSYCARRLDSWEIACVYFLYFHFAFPYSVHIPFHAQFQYVHFIQMDSMTYLSGGISFTWPRPYRVGMYVYFYTNTECLRLVSVANVMTLFMCSPKKIYRITFCIRAKWLYVWSSNRLGRRINRHLILGKKCASSCVFLFTRQKPIYLCHNYIQWARVCYLN